MKHLINDRIKSFFYSGFIFIYIFAFCLSILFRIESWPFSDYGVFKNSKYLKHVNKGTVYAPYFKLSDKKHISTASKEMYLRINRELFAEAVKWYSDVGFEMYIISLINSREMRQVIKKMRQQNIIPIKFVVMEITFKKIGSRQWSFTFDPLKEYDLEYKRHIP